MTDLRHRRVVAVRHDRRPWRYDGNVEISAVTQCGSISWCSVSCTRSANRVIVSRLGARATASASKRDYSIKTGAIADSAHERVAVLSLPNFTSGGAQICAKPTYRGSFRELPAA